MKTPAGAVLCNQSQTSCFSGGNRGQWPSNEYCGGKIQKTRSAKLLNMYNILFTPSNTIVQMETSGSEVIYAKAQGETRVIIVLITHYIKIVIGSLFSKPIAPDCVVAVREGGRGKPLIPSGHLYMRSVPWSTACAFCMI